MAQRSFCNLWKKAEHPPVPKIEHLLIVHPYHNIFTVLTVMSRVGEEGRERIWLSDIVDNVKIHEALKNENRSINKLSSLYNTYSTASYSVLPTKVKILRQTG